LAERCDARSEIYLFVDDAKLFRHITQVVINSYYNMVFMIYKTGVTNGCLNLIHQNARSYPSNPSNIYSSLVLSYCVRTWSDPILIIVVVCAAWAPYRKGDIEDLEKEQKRATRLLPELK